MDAIRPSPRNATASAHEAATLDRAVGRSFRRLLPILFACYVLAYIDRINFGFAAISMNAELGVSLAQFGLAGTIFYVTYFACEIPSNLLLVRFGARRWIARIMISWGLASMATCLASGPTGLYVARAVLGMAEAGFVPGVLLYLTYWFPAARRGRATALFMTAQPLAIAVGSPLSGLILGHMDQVAGMSGWQWLFIIEAAPTVLLGLVVLKHLPDSPATAPWMPTDEAAALSRQLASEPVRGRHGGGSVPMRALLSGSFVALSLAYLALVASLSTLGTWSPLILKDIFAGASALQMGLAAALPGVVAVVAMPLLSASSDRRQERARHFAIAACIAAAGWFATTLAGSPFAQLAGLVAATAAGFSSMPILWTLPPTMLAATARPVGIAVLSSCGILGSIISPMLNGFLRQATGSYVATGWLGVAWMLAAALCVLLAVQLQRRYAEMHPGA